MTTKEKAERYDILMIGLERTSKLFSAFADSYRCVPIDKKNLTAFELFQLGSELAFSRAADEVRKLLEVD